jgi:hypothetical protein
MRLGWRGALGLALSAGLLWWVLRDVSFAEVWHRLTTSDPVWWTVSVVASQAIFVLRTWRWRPILHDVAPALPFGPLWRATVVGMAVNNAFPARLGELARAVLLTRERREVGFTAAFGSLVVDRLFDAIVVIGLLVLATLAPEFPRDFAVGGRAVVASAAGAGAVVAVAFVALYLFILLPGPFERAAFALVRRVAPAREPTVQRALHGLERSLGALKAPARFAGVLAWTVAHWVLNAFAMWAGMRAMGIAVPFTASLLVQGLIVIGVSIPSSPGYFGIWESVAKVALAVYAVPGELAVSWGLCFHILSFIPVTALGLWYLARSGLSLGELGARSTAAPPSADT